MMMDACNILTVNARGARCKASHLKYITNTFKIDILLVQETGFQNHYQANTFAHELGCFYLAHNGNGNIDYKILTKTLTKFANCIHQF